MWWLACAHPVSLVRDTAATAVDADADVDADTDADVGGSGDLAVTTHLRLYSASEVDCATATLTEITLEIRDAKVTIPCDGAVFTWFGVPAGSGELSGFALGSYRYYAGDEQVSVARDGLTPIDLMLDCHEKTGVRTVCGDRD
jgi:hypothetical protein